MRIPFPTAFPALLLLLLTGRLDAQEATDGPEEKTEVQKAVVVGKPVKLDISRRFLKNFLTDELALIPYEKGDGEFRDMPGAFMIGSPSARYVAIWDPTPSRLVGVLDLQAPRKAAPQEPEPAEQEPASTDSEDEEAPSPYVFTATGTFPFQGSSGAFGNPSYFGFRVVSGRPCFLYTHGSLIVEETLWLEDGGSILKQQFSLRDPEGTIAFRIPDDMDGRVASDRGEWDGTRLEVASGEAESFTLTYQLSPPGKEEEPE